MSKFFFALAVSICLFSACNTTPKITGELTGIDLKKIYLYEIKNEYYRQYLPIDSAIVKDGKFEIDLTGKQNQLCFLGNSKEKIGAVIFIESSKIKIANSNTTNGDFKWRVEGSQLDSLYHNYLSELNRIKETQKVDSLNKLFYAVREDGNREEMARIKKQTVNVLNQNRTNAEVYVLKTIDDNKDNAFGMYLYYNNVFGRKEYHSQEDIQEARVAYNSFEDAAKATPYLAKIEKSLEAYSKCAIGHIAPEVIGRDTTGNEMKLSDFRGKYVLVDFWSSTCKYCRLETPNFHKALSKYKDKNLTVLGISSDWKKEMWMKAIHEDESYWPQMLLDKENINKIMDDYCINGIPHIILVDPQGKILAKGLRGKNIYEVPGKYLN